MKTEDLYAVENCPACGQQMHKVANFCPHCGHVKAEGGWRELWERLSAGWRSPERDQASPTVVSIVVGVIVAGIVLYQVLANRSFEGIFAALIALLFLVQTLLKARKKDRQGDRDIPRLESASAAPKAPETADKEGLPERFYCEKCGAEVGKDDPACPECGLTFGSPNKV